MSQTHSIIVYTNPAQQVFWEGGYAFPLGAALLMGMLVFIALMHATTKWISPRSKWFNTAQVGSGIAAAAAAVMIFNHLFI